MYNTSSYPVLRSVSAETGVASWTNLIIRYFAMLLASESLTQIIDLASDCKHKDFQPLRCREWCSLNPNWVFLLYCSNFYNCQILLTILLAPIASREFVYVFPNPLARDPTICGPDFLVVSNCWQGQPGLPQMNSIRLLFPEATHSLVSLTSHHLINHQLRNRQDIIIKHLIQGSLR